MHSGLLLLHFELVTHTFLQARLYIGIVCKSSEFIVISWCPVADFKESLKLIVHHNDMVSSLKVLGRTSFSTSVSVS